MSVNEAMMRQIIERSRNTNLEPFLKTYSIGEVGNVKLNVSMMSHTCG